VADDSTLNSAVDPDLPALSGPLHPRLVAAVAFGGVVGALGRYGLGVALPTQAGTFPVTTLVINLSGAFLLAVLVGVLTRRPGASPVLRPLLGTGVLGGYTTFSTFAVDTDRLVSTGHPATAVSYLAATLLGGLVATAAGMIVSAR
jgi:CrcB protein